MLVPLTNSLYVKGELTSTDKVLVDVGTGFLIEKVRLTCPFATEGSADWIEFEIGGKVLRRQGQGT